MIHFDTDALIYLPQRAREGHPVVDRVADGEPAAACAIAWYEYLCGPLAPGEAELAHAFLQGRVVAVTEDDAQLAARLFDATGRRRAHRTDTLIAACAIRARAAFVTLNVADFEPLVEHGLTLVAGSINAA